MIMPDDFHRFTLWLQEEERSPGTIENYLRHIRAFYIWMGKEEVTKERTVIWKEHLICQGYCPATINAMIVSLNRFLGFLGWQDCKVKTLRIQRKMFREDRRELSRLEYDRLIETARDLGRERLVLLMETICSTGIRVSEIKYITVEALRAGKAEITLKGKIRTILLPGKLAKKLLKYAKKQKTVSGEIFLTRNGTGLSRKQIWAEMKSICAKAGIAASKVFPHNLRYLFARLFYRSCRDIVRLADVLGHSSINTTRIYLVSSGTEHARLLEKLGLVV